MSDACNAVVSRGGDLAYIINALGIMTILTSQIDVSSGWVISDAQGINDVGQIAATGYNSSTGATHALLLSPAAVPEPETYAMMLVGLALVGGTTRRRKRTMVFQVWTDGLFAMLNLSISVNNAGSTI